MSLFKKQPKPEPETKQPNTNGKFRQFAFILAWVSFLAVIGTSIFDAIKEHEPPEKDDYYK